MSVLEGFLMETIRIYKFLVRKSFADFNVKDRFKAAVRTYVSNGIELQDFVMEDGRKYDNVPCECTQFLERGVKEEKKGGQE